MTPNYTVQLVAYPLNLSESAPIGICLVEVDGTYQVSTLATRGTRKSSGIVTSVGGVNNSVFIQSYGDISTQLSGLGDGVACYVRVGDTGYLERRPSIVETDDIVGWTEEDGTVHLFFGGLYNTTGGGGTGNAISIQDWPVSPLDPNIGDTLVFDGFSYNPAPGGGGGSGNALSIQNNPVQAGTPPNNKSVYVWNGSVFVPRQLTQSDIGPDFSVSLSGAQTVEVGATINNPPFTASYVGGTPTAAQITNNNGDTPLNLSSPYTSGSPAWAIAKTANNASVLVTITAQPGSVTDSVSLIWRPRVFYGNDTDPGTITEAFIESLASQPLAANNSRTVNYNCGPGEYAWYCVPTAYGVPTGTVGGFPFGASVVDTVSVTNGFGVTQNYYVVRSNLAGLGAFTVVWS